MLIIVMGTEVGFSVNNTFTEKEITGTGSFATSPPGGGDSGR